MLTLTALPEQQQCWHFWRLLCG